MQSVPVEARCDDAPTMSEGAEAWSQLCAKMAQRARLDAEIVELTGRVQRSGTIEELEGISLDTALHLVHRLPSADRAMQLTAAEVLADMPTTAALFSNADLSWGQVRGIVTEAKRLSRDARAALDSWIAASQDRLQKMDPDDVVDGARAVVLELRNLRSVERSEAEQARGNFFWGQTTLFGRGKVYGELDPLSFAAVFSGVDAMTPSDDGRSVSQRRADGLVALATHRCDASPGEPDAAEDDSATPPTDAPGAAQ